MSIFTTARQAVESGANIQSEVRKVIDTQSEREAINTICEGVAEFKEWAEDHFVSAAGIDHVNDRRKQVNNVINDISRICRKDLDVSIRCVSRKGGYVYKAATPTARPKPTPATPKKAGPYDGWSDAEVVEYMAKHKAHAILTEIVKEHGTVGFMEILKNVKESLDTVE